MNQHIPDPKALKPRSLKLKMALWYTFILLMICIVFMSVILSIYRSAERKTAISTLEKIVDDTALNSSKTDTLINGTSDYSAFIADDVQLMIYDENGEHVAGFFYPELNSLPLTSDTVPARTELGGNSYYYINRLVKDSTNPYYIRGIIATENDLSEMIRNHREILAAIPVLLLMALTGGYFLTRSFLKPVRNMRRTADEIRRSSDLSRRIRTNGRGDELDELAKVINAMFDKLENDFEAQKQFTSNVSHELRTPVSVILAQCEYGFDKADDPEELLQIIASIQEQGYKMSGLINTMLMFTRIEQGTEKYPKSENDLTETVHSLCEDMRIIDGKNITITEDLEDVTANVNKEMFSLMTGNLIQNAVKYGKENGHVNVTLKSSGDYAVLKVSDDGIGIPEEDLPHIWERFYRSDKSRSTKGTGLGLALVKEIAEYHGGFAEAESTEGKGSCFTVKIRI